jgi:hypothetical protein
MNDFLQSSNFTLSEAKALVARVKPRRNEDNFLGAMLLKKGTIKGLFSAIAVALVARNFLGAMLLKKGTIK